MDETNQQPAAMPVTPAPTPTQQPPKPMEPPFNMAEWDKQKKQINKQFFGSFSPRLFNIPFSFGVDKLRAKEAAVRNKYQVVDGGMVLLTPSMLMGKMMLEVSPTEGATGAIDLSGKQLYTKVMTRPWPAMKKEVLDLEKEMGQKPTEVYIWAATATQKVLIGVYPMSATPQPITPMPPSAPSTVQPPAQPPTQPMQPTTPVVPDQIPPL